MLLCLFTSFQEKGNICKKTRKVILSGTGEIVVSVHRVLVDYQVAVAECLLVCLYTIRFVMN